MDWYGMMDILTPLLATLLVTLVSWGVFELKKFVKAKTDNQLMWNAADAIGEAANATVAELNATLKKELEKDGGLSKENAAEIKAVAVRQVKAMLSTQATKVASKVIVDLDGYIAGKVEEGVTGAKVTPSP
jgi:hypothetical protein